MEIVNRYHLAIAMGIVLEKVLGKDYNVDDETLECILHQLEAIYWGYADKI